MTLISRLTITLALIMPIGAIASLEGIKPELGKNLTKEDIIVAYKSNPDIVLDILTILLRTENIDEQLTVQSAFEIAPETRIRNRRNSPCRRSIKRTYYHRCTISWGRPDTVL